MTRIVLDTNVLVAGILSEQGPPGWILDLVTAQELSIVYDSRILAEYREVLARPELSLNPDRAKQLLSIIEDRGTLLTPLPRPHELPDRDDEPFLATAHAAGVDLVTGNTRHFPKSARGGVRASTPREFIESLRRG
ncbi:MAG: putative toxin-antitoxin system toxin component, PIN family [Candidatus Binatia bacterium]